MIVLKRKKHTQRKAGLSLKDVRNKRVYFHKRFASIPIRLKKETYEHVRLYANSCGMKIPEVAEQALWDFIEEQIDLKLYEEAMKEYDNEPAAYTIEEVEKRLGL